MENQAIVILGGFLSNPSTYRKMSLSLGRPTGQPVWVVQVRMSEWLLLTSQAGWSYLLNKLSRTVHQAMQASKASRVVLIGHSAGGVLGRLYLSPEPFRGRKYAG